MNFKARVNGRDADQALIDLTPLIDIVFLLLIFFLITTTFVTNPGIEVDLPKASAAASAQEGQEVIVAITGAGELVHEGRVVAADELRAIFKRVHTDNPRTLVVLQADQVTQHGRVVQVMNLANQVGLTRLGIATQPE